MEIAGKNNFGPHAPRVVGGLGLPLAICCLNLVVLKTARVDMAIGKI